MATGARSMGSGSPIRSSPPVGWKKLNANGVALRSRRPGLGAPSSHRNASFTWGVYRYAMSFRKPFKAVPIVPGEHYQEKLRQQRRKKVAWYLGGAALVGGVAGVLSVPGTGSGAISLLTSPPAGVEETSEPLDQPSRKTAYWRRCDDARAAGAAPIYWGEPGYRSGLDRDNDGIACEPYPGV